MKPSPDSSEDESPNWGAFYGQLGITGPKFLENVPSGLGEFIEFEARGSE
jgi:hypothetical protein